MLSSTEIVSRLAVAALFGALIGLERERKDWVAGMRTHMMVCVGSSLIMMVSSFGFSDVMGMKHVILDPSRIAAQVISGIGFIGAGTILFMKQGTIRGLTTASGLWTVAAIGLATGGGMYFAASIATLLSLIILWALQPLERNISERFRRGTLRIVTNSGADQLAVVKTILRHTGNGVRGFNVDNAEEESVFNFRFGAMDANAMEVMMNELKKELAIKEMTWNR